MNKDIHTDGKNAKVAGLVWNDKDRSLVRPENLFSKIGKRIAQKLSGAGDQSRNQNGHIPHESASVEQSRDKEKLLDNYAVDTVVQIGREPDSNLLKLKIEGNALLSRHHLTAMFSENVVEVYLPHETHPTYASVNEQNEETRMREFAHIRLQNGGKIRVINEIGHKDTILVFRKSGGNWGVFQT